MELHLINCCLSTRIKRDRNNIFVKILMKINKNATNAYACYNKMINNTMYIVKDLYAFSNELHSMNLCLMDSYSIKLHSNSHYKAFYFHQCFHYTLQVIYQLFYFYAYSFYNLSILLCHMIYHIRTHNYWDSK